MACESPLFEWQSESHESTIADVALYGYTHLAGEDGAGMDLKPYPNVLSWLERVKAQPGHVTLMQ